MPFSCLLLSRLSASVWCTRSCWLHQIVRSSVIRCENLLSQNNPENFVINQLYVFSDPHKYWDWLFVAECRDCAPGKFFSPWAGLTRQNWYIVLFFLRRTMISPRRQPFRRSSNASVASSVYPLPVPFSATNYQTTLTNSPQALPRHCSRLPLR